MIYTFLFDILGQYAYQFLIQMISSLVLLFAVLVFTHPMKRRKLFPVWLALGFIAYLGVFYLNAILLTDFESFFVRCLTAMLKFLMPLFVLFLCYRERLSTIIIHWCAGCAAGEAAAKSFSLLLVVRGLDPAETINLFSPLPMSELRDYLIFYAFQLLVCVGLYLLFGRSDLSRNDPQRNISVAILSFASILLISVITSITREHQAESFALNTTNMVYDVLICIFILFLRSGILSLSTYRQEIQIMEQVMYEERKQYQSVKESMNVINMKCHDLKHQLSEISSKLTDSEIAAMREAVQIYENNIKTGNEVLDVILYQKQLLCSKEDIRLSALCNGTILGFMRTTHIYALFNNAIDNAFEAVRKLNDPEMRVVGLTVEQERDEVRIEVNNYFSGKIKLENGFPATSKADKGRHGFGVMSIRYIAEQYGGTVSIEAEGGIFTLTVRIPIPEKH